MKRIYKDYYGTTATIERLKNGKWFVQVRADKTTSHNYETLQGARASLTDISDSFRMVGWE